MNKKWSHSGDASGGPPHPCGSLLSPPGCSQPSSHSPTPSTCSRNSWSEQGSGGLCSDEEAPPLPPRVGSDKRLIQSFNGLEDCKPVLPRRAVKKQESSHTLMTAHGCELLHHKDFCNASVLNTPEGLMSPTPANDESASTSRDIMRPPPPLPTKRSAGSSTSNASSRVSSPETTPHDAAAYLLNNSLLMIADPEVVADQGVLFSIVPDMQL